MAINIDGLKVMLKKLEKIGNFYKANLIPDEVIFLDKFGANIKKQDLFAASYQKDLGFSNSAEVYFHSNGAVEKLKKILNK